MNILKKIPSLLASTEIVSVAVSMNPFLKGISFYYYFQEAMLREMVSGNGLTETTAHFSSLERKSGWFFCPFVLPSPLPAGTV